MKRRRRGPAIPTDSTFPTDVTETTISVSRQIVDGYLADHPEVKAEINRAILAYHSDRWTLGGHLFSGVYIPGQLGGGSESVCQWCGRSREQIRWDDLPPKCAGRPKDADMYVGVVMRREEQLFARVIERASQMAVKIDPTTLTGEELAIIHHTHGIDPSMLEIALMEAGCGPLPQDLHDAYQVAYDQHRQTGKRGGVAKTILTAKIL